MDRRGRHELGEGNLHFNPMPPDRRLRFHNLSCNFAAVQRPWDSVRPFLLLDAFIYLLLQSNKMSALSKKFTLADLRTARAAGDKLAMLTCYDFSTAHVMQ